MTHPTCAYCRQSLPTAAKTGRPRRYCSDACRDGAYRDRQSQAVVWEQLDEPFDPVDEATLRALTIEAVTADLTNRPSASPEERLVRAVIETRVLATQYMRIGQLTRPELSWRAQSMSEALRKDLARYFGEESAE